MRMNELFGYSAFFGVSLSVFSYYIGSKIKKRWKWEIFNPLPISMLLVIAFLLLFDIDYKKYEESTELISYFLTPVTVCLAIPLYRQMQVLKENTGAIIAGVLAGCMTQIFSVIILAYLLKINHSLTLSVLPKSVTTAIALGITQEFGGIPGITIVGVCVAGIGGAIIGPSFLKWTGIKEPVAQGLAMGTASHAIGTSKAIEMGEIQAAMSSLAIVVHGVFAVITIPIVVKIFGLN